jgi:hypothetical protein
MNVGSKAKTSFSGEEEREGVMVGMGGRNIYTVGEEKQ